MHARTHARTPNGGLGMQLKEERLPVHEPLSSSLNTAQRRLSVVNHESVISCYHLVCTRVTRLCALVTDITEQSSEETGLQVTRPGCKPCLCCPTQVH